MLAFLCRNNDGGANEEQRRFPPGEVSRENREKDVPESSTVQTRGMKGVGQVFEGADHFRRVLKTNAILSHRSFTYKKNEKERVVVIYSEEGCTWKIRAVVHMWG